MAKNDYRRSLIMLRAHERGYSGHVRLEHRVMMGSMYFTVSEKNASQRLCALLVRPDACGGYAAVKLGNLRRDGRGQSALAYSFDPRNIAGKPLDDYILIAITAISEGDCVIVLTGNVNGSRDFRFDGVREAVCAACNPKAATNSRESLAAMPEATADDRENSDISEEAADDRENSDISEEAAASGSENTAETETFEPEWNPPSESMPEETPVPFRRANPAKWKSPPTIFLNRRRTVFPRQMPIPSFKSPRKPRGRARRRTFARCF